ncbi:MAG: class I SAM-dependent methyltransferase [Cyanobacteria bacterium P01_E01_bin.42]
MSTKISPQEFYDDLASNYEAKFYYEDSSSADPKKSDEARINAQYVNEAAQIFHKYHRGQQGSVLDMGCGTGLLKDHLEGTFEYTGIDVSPKMLNFASQRGYQTICQPVEQVLPTLSNQSYDFIFGLSSLLFVKDIYSLLTEMNRIARKSIVLSLDDLTEDYIRDFVVTAYNHAGISIPKAKEDYKIRGWTSLTTGITIQTRMIYIEKT